MPATNPIGSDLNARSAARRAKDRRPGVTQASSVLSHWITEYFHVFCPCGPARGCSLKLMDSILNITLSVMARRVSHRDVTNKSAPADLVPIEALGNDDYFLSLCTSLKSA